MATKKGLLAAAATPAAPAARGCSGLFLAVARCSWLLLAVPGCARLCQTVPGCSWLCQAVPGCARRFLAVPGCSWLCQAVPGCARRFLAVPGCSWLRQAVPGCSWLFLPVPGCCWPQSLGTQGSKTWAKHAFCSLRWVLRDSPGRMTRTRRNERSPGKTSSSGNMGQLGVTFGENPKLRRNVGGTHLWCNFGRKERLSRAGVQPPRFQP